jgi:Protein of unknown function (DUF1194)
VNKERYQLQIRGYAEAFGNPLVAAAIAQSGPVAVTLVQWAGYGDYQQVIGWTVVHDAGTASRFASTIAATTRALRGSTSLSGAIDFSARLLRTNGHNARRRIIDVSGDGSNNQGRPARVARNEAVDAGITINGLPILSQDPELDTYYRKHVIGGPGAFLVVAGDFDSFSDAILRKLAIEIAGELAWDGHEPDELTLINAADMLKAERPARSRPASCRSRTSLCSASCRSTPRS